MNTKSLWVSALKIFDISYFLSFSKREGSKFLFNSVTLPVDLQAASSLLEYLQASSNAHKPDRDPRRRNALPSLAHISDIVLFPTTQNARVLLSVFSRYNREHNIN